MDDLSTRVSLALVKHKGSYEKVAKDLLIPIPKVREIDVRVNGKFNYTPEGRGRPELQKYILQIRSVDTSEGWDNKDPKIIEARQLYEDGMIDMVTGRDGLNLILYAIPRKIKANRKPYFSKEAA